MLPLLLISTLAIGAVLGQTPKKGCGNNPADIVFVLDESGSIWGPHFTKQLEFVQSIIESFDIGFNRTHVGVETFGTRERVIFQLGQYTDEAQMKAAVKAIRQQRGETYTNLALKRMREEMFSRQYSRPWVRHVAIVITDGESNYPKETAREADLCHQANIQVFAIGVGTAITRSELEAIASSQDLVFMVDSYGALESLRQILAWKACEPPTTLAPSTTTTTTTTTTEPPPQMIEGCTGRRKMDHIWSISELADVQDTNYAVDFIKSVTQDMNIDPLHVQVGLAPRFCEEKAPILLRDHDTREGFWRDLDRRRLTGIQSHRTLEYLRTTGLSSANGGRYDSVKFGILIVDFESSDWERTLREAQLAKNDGVKLIVIGVGRNIREDQLRQLASTSKHYFHADSYSRLADLKADVIRRFCEAIQNPLDVVPKDFFDSFLFY